MAIYVGLYVYDSTYLLGLQEKLSVIGTIVGLLFGCLIYFLYRFYIYDSIVRRLLERCQKSSYGAFVQNRYKLPDPEFLSKSSWKAQFILNQFANTPDEHPNWQLRASGIHLLYQTGLVAFVFFCLAIGNGKGWPLVFIFGVCAIVLLLAAWGMDRHYEREELELLKSKLAALDVKAASFDVLPRYP